MTSEQRAEAERLRAMVVSIVNGAAQAEATMLGGTAVDGTLMLQAFQFITAAMLEAHPELVTPKDLDDAAETQGRMIHGYIKGFRADFERTGQHCWDMLNAPAEPMN